MKRIIIDTNFLMIPYEFKVDIFSEFNRICDFNYGLFIYEETIDELKRIIKNKPNASELPASLRAGSQTGRITRSQLSGKDKKAAQFALKLIKLKNIGIIKAKQRDVDSLILENANKEDIIATQDINLKKELLKKGFSVIILRQKKYLKFVERKLYK